MWRESRYERLDRRRRRFWSEVRACAEALVLPCSMLFGAAVVLAMGSMVGPSYAEVSMAFFAVLVTGLVAPLAMILYLLR